MGAVIFVRGTLSVFVSAWLMRHVLVSAAVETGHQEEVDRQVRPRQVRGPAPDRDVGPLFAVQRRRQHMELRDPYADQKI